MSYYTPPPSANGSSWGHSAQPQQQGHQPLPGPSHPNSQQQNVNPMFAMMAMMQQMQGYPAQNYPQQFAQPQMAAQVVEPQRMSIPQVTDNSLIAQILYEQTKRGLTYKAALESLHGHNGIAAYAWKDHFLEHKQSIDDLVDKLKEEAARASWIKLEPHRSSSASMDGQSISNNTAVKRQSESTPPRASSETRRDKLHARDPEKTMPYSRETSEPKRPKPSKKLSSSHSDIPIKKAKETNGKRPKPAPKEVASEGGSSRRTLNSLSSTPSQTLLALIPAGVPIDAHTGLPAAPSRSPSPPVADPTHKYTDQDAVYFFKRVAYDLQRDSDLTKANLCDILGDKAPHHSAMSWRTYWTKKEDVADKMLLLTRLDDIDREEVIRSWKTGRSIAGTLSTGVTRPRARNISYKESSDSEGSEMASSTSIAEEDEVEAKVDAELGDANDDSEFPSTGEEEELGEAGSPFTIAEIRALAKHIARQPGWFTGRKDWEPFFSNHSQRSSASWREFYRRRSDEVDSLARKYMIRAKKEHISTQRGKPSWARGLNRSPRGEFVPVKRFYDLSQNDSDSREGSEEKRPRYSD